MARLSRKLRVCKWAGTAGCVLIAVVFVCNIWWVISYQWLSRLAPEEFGITSADHNAVELWFGRITYSKNRMDDHLSYNGWILCPVKRSGRKMSPWFVFSIPAVFRTGQYTIVHLPLWLPFVALLTPTLLLWRRDRRRRPGLCSRCDYDLTGNTSGRCPECGTEIAK